MVLDTTLGQKPAISKRRRITKADIKDIANLVVKYRMNETEACLECGINPKQWSLFKHRHKTSATFEELINGIRARNLRNCLDSIDEAGNTREYESVNKKGEQVTLTKFGDWRAKAWIAERVLAPERMGQQQQTVNATQVNVYAQLGLDVAQLLQQGAERAKAKVIEVKESKLLPAPEHKSEWIVVWLPQPVVVLGLNDLVIQHKCSKLLNQRM